MENVNEIVHKVFPCARPGHLAGVPGPANAADPPGSRLRSYDDQGAERAGHGPRQRISAGGVEAAELTQYVPSQVNGSGLIQDLDVVVWTSPAAAQGSGGGGYQPYPIDKTMAFTMQVGYVWTSSGFQVVVRLVESTPKARTSTAYATIWESSIPCRAQIG